MRTLFAPTRWLAILVALWLPALAAAQTADKPFSKEQLDQLTAQVALFPDALLAQVLMAATYPADVAEAAKWSRANSEQKGDEAVKMVQDQPWDPSVQSLVAFPQVIIMMGEKPGWVKDLGDAFLAQPEDVMDSVQRLRQAAQKAGNLQSNQQIVVNVQAAPPPNVVIETTAPPPPPQVIVIEQRSPEVIFVPMYNPVYVFGPWLWPAYPPIFIPPPPGFWFSTAVVTGIAWGVGIGVRNAIWGSPNWWNRSVNINVNHWNNININNRIPPARGDQRWSHNVDNRRNVPYRDGDRQRQQLQDRAQRVDREQYRGRDADRQRAQDGAREADRQRAQQALQQRGVSTDRAALSDSNRAQLQQQARDLDRGQARERAQGADRGAVQDRAQGMDRSAVQGRAQGADRGRNEAFSGVSDRRAGAEIDRGAASRQSMQQVQRPSGGGGGGARPQAQAQRPSGGAGGASRGGAGGGARGGGGRGR